jgi:hypothetical protein
MFTFSYTIVSAFFHVTCFDCFLTLYELFSNVVRIHSSCFAGEVTLKTKLSKFLHRIKNYNLHTVFRRFITFFDGFFRIHLKKAMQRRKHEKKTKNHYR